MKKTILIILITIAALLLCVLSIIPYARSADLCKVIRNGETEKALEKIREMNDVNCCSAPLWLRDIFNLADEDIELPLVVACEEGNYEVVKSLLEKNADPNRYLDGNWSPIEAAFVSKSESRCNIAEELISHNADVDLYGSRTSALFVELTNWINKDRKNDQVTIDSVILLLENGASLIDKNGNSIVHYIAVAENLKLLEYALSYDLALLDAQNAKGETPLMWAVRNNAFDSVVFLLESGARVDIKDADGKTAMDLAINGQNEEIITMLKNYGAA